MNISIKQVSKQVSLVALLSLPFSASLEAAGWFDAVRNSRIGQWFSEQPKAAQIGLGVGALAAVAATAYCGYRYYDANRTILPIQLSAVNTKQLDGYRIYAFGTDAEMSEKDIDDVTSVLKESDTTICSTQDKRLLFQPGWLFDREHVAAVVVNRELKANADTGLFGVFKDQSFYSETQIFVMRDASDAFIGFALTGIQSHDGKRSYMLFVAPQFRRLGCAKKILLHMAQNLLNQGIREIQFSACKNNEACRWYDTFGFRRSNDSSPGYWQYSGTITQ